MHGRKYRLDFDGVEFVNTFYFAPIVGWRKKSSSSFSFAICVITHFQTRFVVTFFLFISQPHHFGVLGRLFWTIERPILICRIRTLPQLYQLNTSNFIRTPWNYCRFQDGLPQVFLVTTFLYINAFFFFFLLQAFNPFFLSLLFILSYLCWPSI